jgi:hypothetical protein
MQTVEIPVSDVRLVMELYPRLETKMIDSLVEQYRDAIEDLPPIVVARGGILVDGMHRWQAHIREKRETIKAVDLGDISDAEIFSEAVRLNASHGRQLSRSEKKNVAARFWADMAHIEEGERLAEIMRRLSMGKQAVYDATKDARKEEKRAKQDKAIDMWLDCYTDAEIAEAVDVTDRTIAGWTEKIPETEKFRLPPGSDKDTPWGRVQHFDVWNIGTDGGDGKYFGKMPPAIVENLLWLYTAPGEIVFDPFGGSGTTIKVAKAMGRRVWSSDRRGNAWDPTQPIHIHDITTGWPSDAPKKVDLVILDPPYWQQAKGRYDEDAAECLGNMSLSDFYAAWDRVVEAISGHAKRAAFIISPTQNEDGSVEDHAFEMAGSFHAAGWRTERRIIVPYSTQQATGQQVTWARENKRLLKLYRDLVVVSI